MADFSWSYKPGAINFQIWIKINGHEKKNAEKKASFRYVKNVSCRAVNINLRLLPSSLTAWAYGSTRKLYILMLHSDLKHFLA